MNWYKVIKLASPQNKIKSLGVNNAFGQAFIYKYEDIVPWGEITDQEVFWKYIQQLNAGLKNQIFEAKNPRSQDILNNWWLLLDEWNKISGMQAPALYIVMKPLTDWAKNQIAPPPVVMPRIVDGILADIMENPSKSVNFLREYRKRAVPVERNDGWYEFGTSDLADDDYDEDGYIVGETRNEKVKGRCEELSLFVQGSGWCLSDPYYAYMYIKNGTVDILVENGDTVAAIASATNGDIKEVRGKFNSIPIEYIDQIKKYTEEQGFTSDRDITPGSLDVITGIKAINDAFDDPKTTNYRKRILLKTLNKIIKGDGIFSFYSALSDKVKSLPITKTYFRRAIKKTLYNTSSFKFFFEGLDGDIINEFAPYIAEVMNHELKNRPDDHYGGGFTLLPKQIKDLINPRALVSYWAYQASGTCTNLKALVPDDVIRLFKAKDIFEILTSRQDRRCHEIPEDVQLFEQHVDPTVMKEVEKELDKRAIRTTFNTFANSKSYDRFLESYMNLDQSQRLMLVRFHGNEIIDYLKEWMWDRGIYNYVNNKANNLPDAEADMDIINISLPSALERRFNTMINGIVNQWSAPELKSKITYDLI